MSNIKDKEKLQNLEDKDVEQVSGGADKEKKYKGSIPEWGVLEKYGGPMPRHDCPLGIAYGMPTPKHIDLKLFLEHKKDEDSGEE